MSMMRNWVFCPLSVYLPAYMTAWLKLLSLYSHNLHFFHNTFFEDTFSHSIKWYTIMVIRSGAVLKNMTACEISTKVFKDFHCTWPLKGVLDIIVFSSLNIYCLLKYSLLIFFIIAFKHVSKHCFKHVSKFIIFNEILVYCWHIKYKNLSNVRR